MCSSPDSDTDLCDTVNADYATCVYTGDCKSSLDSLMLLGKSKAKVSQESNSFGYDFAMGTAVGALSAATTIFVIKSCTNKNADRDNFHRI